MARRNEYVFALNAGAVDKEALSRIDLEKLRLAGEHPVSNWFPRVMGPMTLRPGIECCSRLTSDAVARPVPFERDSATAVVLAMQANVCTIYQDGQPVQVVNSSSVIANPTFSSALSGAFTTGWKDDSETGDGTDGTASSGTGTLVLTATKYRSASVQQSVAIAGGDQAKAHTVRIVVARGPVYVRMGTSQDAEDLLTEQRLSTGTHKLTVTPNASALWIKIRSEDREAARFVTECRFEHTALGGAGNLTLPTPWAEADLPYLSWDQASDVLFIGDGVSQPRRIERRGASSWSIVLYQTRNGPLRSPTTDKVRFTPSTYTSNGTLTSSLPYFKQSHVGSLFELTHPEQHVIEELNGVGQTTGSITVTGLATSTSPPGPFNDRNFGYTISFSAGTFVGEIAVERSTDAEGLIWTEWTTHLNGGGDVSTSVNDEQSNLTCRYRFRVKAYTSGYANVTMTYLMGSTTGLVRIAGFTSATSVEYEVVKTLGGVTATANWRGPAWTDDLGWPRVPRFRDGRLHWFFGDTDYASAVDDYDNYDDAMEGDSAPFVRTVGSGAADGVRWALDMDKLSVGTSSYVASVQASDLGEALTPTNFAVRRGPSVGASFVPPAQIDDRAIMADKTNRRLYEIGSTDGTAKLSASDATRLNPSAVASGVKAMAVQRQPDTRVYAVLDDGTCAVFTFERDDRVAAFTDITPHGYASSSSNAVEDVCVIPGPTQDRVYFVVRLGSQRWLARLALEADQRSVSACALLDFHTVLMGSVSAINGATRFAGQTVQVWADGRRRAPVTLDGSGNGSLGGTYARVVYGLGFKAAFRSVKLAYGAQLGTAIGQTKIVKRVSPILSNSVLDGVRVGQSSAATDPMPASVNGAWRTDGQFFAHLDEDPFPIPGDWDTDSRVYIEADSAYGPVTVQAIAIDIETREGVNASRGDG
jgi:hypothetical protein